MIDEAQQEGPNAMAHHPRIPTGLGRVPGPVLADLEPWGDRGRALTEDVLETLRNHRQLHDRSLAVAVRGGVAHVSGEVGSGAEREQVRRVVARVRGVLAVWDVLRAPGEGEPRVLDIGCGPTKQHAWAVGVDRHPFDGVAVVADIERGLPFADGEADQVFAVHILEHVRDLVGLMNEIHRVLKPGGVLHAMVPNGQFVNAFADPTHVRHFHLQTFKYFCRPCPWVRPFRPVAASSAVDNILADLQPVKPGEPLPDAEELARCFD